MMKKTLLCAAVSVLASQAVLADNHDLQVSASVDVASNYLLRGVDLGGPTVMGNLRVEDKIGLYADVEVVSSDEKEQNYAVGFARTFGDYDVDVNYKKYTYDDSDMDRKEASLDITRDAITLSVDHDLDDTDRTYVAGSFSMGKLTSTLGVQRAENDMGYKHLQFDYQMTDSLTLTASQARADDDDSGVSEDLHLVVGYSLPL